jgi:AraC family transcriptional regulator
MQSLHVSQHHQVDPQELVAEALPTHLIVIHTTSEPVRVIERAEDLHLAEWAQPGDVNILPAGIPSACRC